MTLGSVPYLNAKPLVRWFSDTPEGHQAGVHVIEAVPSALAKMLEADTVAAALVSSVELFRAPNLTHAPGIGVVADGPVESVRLLSRVPIEEIKTVALDTSSLTSVALLKILLTEQYHLSPSYVAHAPDLDAMLTIADAGLLIGDIGYRAYDSQLHVLDLGAGWKTLTGLPFVYACWVGRAERLSPALVDTLARAKAWGTQHLVEIANAEHAQLGETQARARHYLTEVMRYDIAHARSRPYLCLATRCGNTNWYNHGKQNYVRQSDRNGCDRPARLRSRRAGCPFITPS